MVGTTEESGKVDKPIGPMTGPFMGAMENILNASVNHSSGKISPSEPGALEIVTEPMKAQKKRQTRIVSKFFATQDGMTKRVYSTGSFFALVS